MGTVPDEMFRKGGVGMNPEPTKALPENPPVASLRVFWAIKKDGRPSHQCGGKWRRRIRSALGPVTGVGYLNIPFPFGHTCLVCGSYYYVSSQQGGV